jgi:hypothetical protein
MYTDVRASEPADIVQLGQCRLCTRQTKKPIHRCPHEHVCRANDYGYPECPDCREGYNARWDAWARQRRGELSNA